VSLVLISDDDAGVRADLKKVLEKSGHSVLEAKSARETIEEAQDNDVDLLLLDITLPGMPALQLLEELRSESASPACRS